MPYVWHKKILFGKLVLFPINSTPKNILSKLILSSSFEFRMYSFYSLDGPLVT